MNDFLEKVLDKNLGEELRNYIENDLFEQIYVLHPVYAVHGRIENDSMELLKKSGTEVIITPDRNIISLIETAVKKGSFDGGNRKKITSFLAWTVRYGFSVNPFDSIREGVYRNGNIVANKEIELFNYFYDNVLPDAIVKSFYNEGILFEAKAFNDTSSDEVIKFTNDNPSFNFIYAAMLHFVYVLRTETKLEKRFYNFFEWYLNECIISEYVIAYTLLFLEGKGAPPHNTYKNDIDVINGCINEAYDLLYVQELDPNRYPSDKYTMIFATQDKLLFKVFELVNDRTKYSTVDEYLNVLFEGFPHKKRNEYLEFFNEKLSLHTCKVNPENALSISKELVEKEEKQLKDLLNM